MTRTRQMAIASGLKTYFTGSPCHNGHVAERVVSNRSCIECLRSRTNVWRKNNRGHVAAYQRQYIEDNREDLNAAQRARRAKNPERFREENSRDYHKHKAKRLATAKRWRERNLDRVKESDRKKSAEHPDRYRAYKRNYKARKRAAEGAHTAADVAQILKMQRGKCAICRAKVVKYHVDHIVPLFLGGTNDRQNLQIACGSCNQSKHAKDPIAFMQQRGMLI